MKQYIDGNRAYQLLEQIGFVRNAGTEEELRAANILCDYVKNVGVDAVIEPFSFETSVAEQVEFTVLAPYEKTYTVTAMKLCENTPEEGLEADFLYVENGMEANLVDAKGKIVLINGYLRLPIFKRLLAAGVAGVVTMGGTMLETLENSDLITTPMRDTVLAFGNMPAMSLRMTDGFELVEKGASRVRMVIKNNNYTATSHNVVATISGTKYPEEIISFGAHYDSSPYSPGVYDNGAGSVLNMEVLHYFAEHPPLRTLKFVWFGSEEIGLLGSKAYVDMHKEEIEHHRVMVNVDVGATVLGYDICKVLAEKSVVDYADLFMRKHGYAVDITQDISSSDCISFANAGVPALNYCRVGADGAAFIHTRHDVMDYLSADALEKTAVHLLDFTETFINAVVFPLERTIPTVIVEAVDTYLFKKELAEVKGSDEATTK